MKKEDLNLILMAVITALLLVLVFINVVQLNYKCSRCAYNQTDYDTGVSMSQLAVVTEINNKSILVENGTFKASVTITDKTIITVGNLNKVCSFSSINVDDEIIITFDGPIADSYPGQGKAYSINIINREDC